MRYGKDFTKLLKLMRLNSLNLNEYYNIKSFIVVLYRVFATDIIVIKIIKSVFVPTYILFIFAKKG